jgi:hypothetical protein
MDNDPGTIGELWTRHAEAEFWAADFNRVINKRRNAVILADIRDLH